jgi:hypothetical protein
MQSLLPLEPFKSKNGSSTEQRVTLQRTLSQFAAEPIVSHGKFLASKSNLEFDQPHQTLIFLDWDDSLFPTTYLKDKGIAWYEKCPEPYQPVFDRCCGFITAFLEKAAALGSVSIITLATSPWVSLSIQNFMPNLEPIIEKLRIPIIYAKEELMLADNTNAENFNTTLKRRAMTKAAKRFYSQYKNQSWKNIISVGDSNYERDALIEVVSNKKQGENRKCRVKTLKLADCPDIEQVNAQLDVLKSWIPSMVAHDNNFDIDMDGPVDNVINWNNTFKK